MGFDGIPIPLADLGEAFLPVEPTKKGPRGLSPEIDIFDLMWVIVE